MKERGILFSAPMVRALIAGTKTQTRRIVKDEWAHGFVRSESFGYRKRPLKRESGDADFVTFSEPYAQSMGEPVWFYSWGNDRWLRCPYGKVGDTLWVREAWSHDAPDLETCRAAHEDACGGLSYGPYYRATEVAPDTLKWKPGIHMPRWASRITLEITEVRVQRLQEISEENARAEGVPPFFERYDRIGQDQHTCTGELARDYPYRACFACAWDEINGDRALWSSNPWVFAITFKCVEQP